MPAAIPVVIALVSAVAAATPAAWISFAITCALTAASYALQSSEGIDAEEAAVSAGQVATAEATGHLTNTKSITAPLPLVYGTMRVGVNWVYMGTSGDDNKYMHLIGTICEGEIDSIVQDDNGDDKVWVNDKMWNDSSYNGLFTYTFHNGSSTQVVDPTITAAITSFTDPMIYTAYLYCRVEYDSDVWQGLPAVTVEVKGKKCYNPTTTVTEWTHNPAICAWDFMTTSSRRGGMGIAAARLDTTSWGATLTYCDDHDWQCNMVLQDNSPAMDLMQLILDTFRGSLIYSINKFFLKYKDLNHESAVMALTVNDIAESGGISSLKIEQPSIFDTPNAIRLKYYNEDNKYIIDDFILTDSTAITADGDYREDAKTMMLTRHKDAERLAAYLLERQRTNKTVSFNMGSRGMALEPHDLVTITHDIPGWSAKTFRVQSAMYSENGEVAVNAIEESSGFYNDVYNVVSTVSYDSTLLGPSDTIPSVSGLTISEALYSYRDRSFTRLHVDFTKPSPSSYPFWDYGEAWVSIDSTDNYRFFGKYKSDFNIDPVQEGERYFVKIKSVNIFGGVESELTAQELGHEVEGLNTPPGDVTNACGLVNGDTITLLADILDESDIQGYEVRYGETWFSGRLIGFQSKPKFHITGVKPGTYTLWICAKDNAGQYSNNPAQVVCTIFYPPGYVDVATWQWDYSAGTFNNTEQTLTGAETEFDYMEYTDDASAAGAYVRSAAFGGTIDAITYADDTSLKTAWVSNAYASTSYASSILRELRLNGTHGDTVLYDEKLGGNWSNIGNGALTTAVSRWGNACLDLPSAASHCIASTFAGGISTKAWTLEYMFLPESATKAIQTMSHLHNSGYFGMVCYWNDIAANKFDFYGANGGAWNLFNGELSATYTMSTSAWNKFILQYCPSSGAVQGYNLWCGCDSATNLQHLWTGSTTSPLLNATQLDISAFNYMDGNYNYFYNGKIDNVRFTAGAAVYTSTTIPYDATELRNVYEPSREVSGATVSMKIDRKATSCNGEAVRRTFATALNLSYATNLTIDLYYAATGTHLEFRMHDSGGITSTFVPTISTANEWKTVTWNISGIDATARDAIDYIEFVANSTSTDANYVDNIIADTTYGVEVFSESTILKQGSNSIKIVADATISLNNTFTHTCSKNLTDMEYITIWVRASRDGSNFKLGIHDSGGTTTEKTITIAVANVWQQITWDISGVANADKDDIDTLIITITNADAENIIYLDDMVYLNITGSGLKCSHTGDVLVGTWVSPVYDLTTSTNVRCWGDFSGEQTGGLTWDSLPETIQWDAASYLDNWRRFTGQADIAAQIAATFCWGDDTKCTAGKVGYFELHSQEVKAQYVKVELTITDPATYIHYELDELDMVAAYW